MNPSAASPVSPCGWLLVFLAALVNTRGTSTLPCAIWRLILASLAKYSRSTPSCAADRQRASRLRCSLERVRWSCNKMRVRHCIDALECSETVRQPLQRALEQLHPLLPALGTLITPLSLALLLQPRIPMRAPRHCLLASCRVHPLPHLAEQMGRPQPRTQHPAKPRLLRASPTLALPPTARDARRLLPPPAALALSLAAAPPLQRGLGFEKREPVDGFTRF